MIGQHTLEHIQQQLKQRKLDGWLLYDFRRNNRLAIRMLAISQASLLTRRLFYWISAEGEPIKLVHAIEPYHLEHLPGMRHTYSSWQQLHAKLAEILSGASHIAMEYSPDGAIPYVSLVDGGTVEMVKNAGDLSIHSSADLLQQLCCVWNDEELRTHHYAAGVVESVVEEMWGRIAKALIDDESVTEHDIQQEILRRFEEEGCVTDAPPICAVNAHSADPHYMPLIETSSLIRRGDFILIDLWCRADQAHATYADITRVAVAGETASARHQEIFGIVRKARDAAIDLVCTRYSAGSPIQGWEVDDVCRKVIVDAGYGQYFTHRTGHNIGQSDHGDGANIDNYETHDTRNLIPGTCFSIEPGIYLPGNFGVRLEVNVVIDRKGKIEVTGGVQDELLCLLNL